MSQIVLVHGAWGGAWIWRACCLHCAPRGTENAVTLTGDGERAHLRHPGITLRTHIADVVGLVEAEELSDVVLVGHSYGGMVITGAADALAGRAGNIVYVDAMVPLPGEGWGEQHPPDVVAARQAAAKANDNALPPPDPADFGLGGADARLAAAPPGAAPLRPLPRADALRRRPLARAAAHLHRLHPARLPDHRRHAPARARASATGRIVELATGHCPMVSMPDRVHAGLAGVGGLTRPAQPRFAERAARKADRVQVKPLKAALADRSASARCLS